MSAEKWRPIQAHPGYEVSDQGRVRLVVLRGRRLAEPRILKIWDGRGSRSGANPRASVSLGDRSRKASVAALVCEAFIGPRPDGLFILHWNDDPWDNRLANLRYGTRQQNAEDARRNRTTRRPVRSQKAA